MKEKRGGEEKVHEGRLRERGGGGRENQMTEVRSAPETGGLTREYFSLLGHRMAPSGTRSFGCGFGSRSMAMPISTQAMALSCSGSSTQNSGERNLFPFIFMQGGRDEESVPNEGLMYGK